MRTLPLVLLAAIGCRGPADDTEAHDVDGDGVVASEDCNDEDATAYPGATETCDGVDNDCNDVVDDDATDATTFYADADDDGYGDASDAVAACDAPDGYVAEDGDCDDADAAFHPGALEDDCADPSDYNCDGSVGYADDDGDGFAACEECDDASADVNPDASEVCNDVDDDCDDEVDEEATDALTFYADTDGDGYGDADSPSTACAAPDGHVDDATDCDDTSGATYPGADELCDDVDQDCDGETRDDDATDATTFYADGDGDGYAADDADTTTACDLPEGYAAETGDCDDTSADANPGVTAACASFDADCDGLVDDDEDGDGYVSEACDGDDCDDSSSDANPGVTAECADFDADCDGLVDSDLDGDGFAATDCGGEDCNDDLAAAYPDASGACAPGQTCADIVGTVADAGTGVYDLDPDGPEGDLSPVALTCDMDFDGGGWTQISRCDAYDLLGATLDTVVAGNSAGVDAECRPFGRDGSGAHAYHYTFDVPGEYTEFRLVDYRAKAYAYAGNTSEISQPGDADYIDGSDWNALYKGGGRGTIAFGDPAQPGAATAWGDHLTSVAMCYDCFFAWAAGNDAVFTLDAPATAFRIGFGETGPEHEGWYAWWDGSIQVR